MTTKEFITIIFYVKIAFKISSTCSTIIILQLKTEPNEIATKMNRKRNANHQPLNSTQLTGVFSLVPYFQQPTSLRCLTPRMHGHEGPRRKSCPAQIVVTAKTTGQVRSHQHSRIPSRGTSLLPCRQQRHPRARR